MNNAVYNLKVKWVEASSLGLEGVGWPGEGRYAYGRLPARAEADFAAHLNTSSDLAYTFNLSQCTASRVPVQ